jgi:hypothetical protein
LPLLEKIAYLVHKQFITKYDKCFIPDFAGKENLSGDLSHKFKLPKNAEFIGILSRFSILEENVENYYSNTYNQSLGHCGLDPQSPKFQGIPAFAGMTIDIFRSFINEKAQILMRLFIWFEKIKSNIFLPQNLKTFPQKIFSQIFLFGLSGRGD